MSDEFKVGKKISKTVDLLEILGLRRKILTLSDICLPVTYLQAQGILCSPGHISKDIQEYG